MSKDLEVEAMSKISEALSSVEDPDARARILEWARGRYLPRGVAASRAVDAASGAAGPASSDGSIEGFGPRASRWMRQSGLSREQINQVFHVDGNEARVIATVPGRYASDRVGNCYLLEGIRVLLANDEPNFTDDAARELCRSAGCYDTTNHAKRTQFDNRITGNATRGWTVTGPGLNAAAALIKGIALPSEGT